MLVGIDLGTTNSAIALMEERGPRLLPNALGEALTPSVVALEADGAVLVGRAAKELQVVQPESAAYAFKRHMGSDWTCRLGTETFTPERLSSLVLRSLKSDAEAELGQPVERAVITVPAYFNELQRRATLKAGQIAGFQVERILNEPTAAAIAYGLRDSDCEKLVAVIDLGGGTFDVSIVELFEGAIEVRASCGECFLGGEDFTDALVARMLEAQGYVFERAEWEHPLLVSRLRQLCEVAKRTLSRQDEVQLPFPGDAGELTPEAPKHRVTRGEMEQWTAHILQRIETPIRRALGDAGLKRQDIDDVILVGGATRMPMLAQRITRLFGKAPRCGINPDEVVALGAGVQAGLIGRNAALDDLVVTDVAPFTLGIEIAKDFGAEVRTGYFLPIIDRNTTIPVSRVNRIVTIDANQRILDIKIFQGESRLVDSNLLLGKFTIDDIPLGPPGQEVDVRFTYDLNGVLEVEATVVESQRKLTHVVACYAQGLSEQQIVAAVEAMQELKTHPREDAANRLLLRRANRVYQELSFEDRRILEQILDGFEQVLDMGDKPSIEKHRVALTEFLDRFDSESNTSSDESW